jgi:hypothetical protein
VAAEHHVAVAQGDGAARRRELDGVGQQVLHDVEELGRVDGGDGAGAAAFDGDLEAAALDERGEVALHPLDDHRHVGAAELELDPPGFELGQGQQVIHQPRQAVAALVDAFEVAEDLVFRHLAEAAEPEAGVGQDAVERRAELVGHVGEELALEPVGPLGAFLGLDEVGRLGRDQFGEVVAVAAELCVDGLAGRDVLAGAPIAEEGPVRAEMGLAGDAEPGVADDLRVDAVFEVAELLPPGDEVVVGVPFGAVGQVFGAAKSSRNLPRTMSIRAGPSGRARRS